MVLCCYSSQLTTLQLLVRLPVNRTRCLAAACAAGAKPITWWSCHPPSPPARRTTEICCNCSPKVMSEQGPNTAQGKPRSVFQRSCRMPKAEAMPEAGMLPGAQGSSAGLAVPTRPGCEPSAAPPGPQLARIRSQNGRSPSGPGTEQPGATAANPNKSFGSQPTPCVLKGPRQRLPLTFHSTGAWEQSRTHRHHQDPALKGVGGWGHRGLHPPFIPTHSNTANCSVTFCQAHKTSPKDFA